MHQNIKNEIQKNIEKLQLKAEKLLKSNQSNMLSLWSEYSTLFDIFKGNLIDHDNKNEYENLFYIHLIIEEQYRYNIEILELNKNKGLIILDHSNDLTNKLKENYKLTRNIKV